MNEQYEEEIVQWLRGTYNILPHSAVRATNNRIGTMVTRDPYYSHRINGTKMLALLEYICCIDLDWYRQWQQSGLPTK